MQKQVLDFYDNIKKSLGARIQLNAPMAPKCGFQTGGEADLLFAPETIQELQEFLRALPPALNPVILGGGSNVLIRDAGIRAPVIWTANLECEISTDDCKITAGAGTKNAAVAANAANAGISGLEFLCGIPGTIGGAARGNAGAYGGAMSDIVQHLDIVNRAGELISLSADELKYSYRNLELPQGCIIVGMELQGMPANPDDIRARMLEYATARKEKQPAGLTLGSAFKNPPGDFAGRLIEAVGLKGVNSDGAYFSEKHANFLMNDGSAASADLEALLQRAQKEVMDKFDVALEPEIKIIGDLQT
ncbi:MAG: UDP-N-acetylmuramate dehydrogenase [Alphaproteobacteria bacterium]|nr:UDP-N-acetylmuramate dehydrogenase [Alphaproteobacteria bacterium]